MCACRCGIKVHLKDGADPLHRGQPRPSGQSRRALRQGLGRHHAALFAGAADRRRCCASASAARASSARSGGTRRWRIATEWLGDIRASDPRKLAFFTGRDQSQALTGWWAQQFGTPNYAAHGGFCSVNMAAAGHLHDRRLVLGVRRARLGAHALFHDVRRRRGSRLATRSRSASASSRRAAPSSSRSIRSAPATRRSPTNGSASARAPTACSCWRWCTSCCAPARSIVDYLVRYTNAPWLVFENPGARRRRLVRARRRGPAAVLGSRARRGVPADATRSPTPSLQGRVRARRRPPRACRSSSCWPSATSIRATRRGGGRATGHARGDHPPHRRRAGAGGVRAAGRAGRCRGPIGPAGATSA